MRKLMNLVTGLAGGGVLLAMSSGAFASQVIYNSIPGPLPPNLPSLGYECCQTAEFGDHIKFAGNERQLTNVTLTLSDWAILSDYVGAGYSASGFTVPMTLNLYAVNNAGPTPAVGSLLASRTVDQLILWRPETPGGCADNTHWLAPDNVCYSGLAQDVSFDFTGTTVPNQIIFGLVFNTTNYGPNPTGVPGPYDSLNFALNDMSGPSVGTDMNPDAVFWNTGYQPFLSTGTAGVFGQDTEWAPYVPAIRFEAVPEPMTLALFGMGLAGVGTLRRRRKAKIA